MNGLIGSTRILQKKGLTRKGRGSRGRKRVFGGAWTCYRGCGGSCNTSGRNKPKEAEWAPDSCTEVGALTNSCTGLAFAVRFHFNPSPPPRPILPPSPVALAFFHRLPPLLTSPLPSFSAPVTYHQPPPGRGSYLCTRRNSWIFPLHDLGVFFVSRRGSYCTKRGTASGRETRVVVG